MRRLALIVVLAGCDTGGGAGAAATESHACEACERTAQCAAPLRCRGFVCVGEGMRCGGEDEGGDAAPRRDCPGLCDAAQGCDGLRPGGELGGDPTSCVAACEGGSPSADPPVLDCLLRRVEQGLCDDESFRECLPPWSPHLAGGDTTCHVAQCRCSQFCRSAIQCGMFPQEMVIEQTGCEALCGNGELERPGSLQCAEDELLAGRCESALVMQCFGLDDGRPPGSSQ